MSKIPKLKQPTTPTHKVSTHSANSEASGGAPRLTKLGPEYGGSSNQTVSPPLSPSSSVAHLSAPESSAKAVGIKKSLYQNQDMNVRKPVMPKKLREMQDNASLQARLTETGQGTAESSGNTKVSINENKEFNSGNTEEQRQNSLKEVVRGSKNSQEKKTSKAPDDPAQRLMKQIKLQKALSEKDQLRGSVEEGEESHQRPSKTVRRYSQVAKDRRLSIKYRDELSADRRMTIEHIPSSNTNTTATADSSVEKVVSANKSQGFLNSVMYNKAKHFATLTSPKTSLKNRKAEVVVLQELIGSRQIRYLVAHTHFEETEVKSLQRMFHILTEGQEGINRALFREIMLKHFGITGDGMLDQIYYYFDTDHQGHISDTKWIRNLSTFLRGSFEEHTKYCFEIYDMKGDGNIGKNEILTLLQDCLQPVSGVEDDITDKTNIREVADMLLRKFDRDKKGGITFEKFRTTVRRDPLSLQCLGQCLPEPEEATAFMALVTDDYNSFKTNYSLPYLPSFAYERDRFNAEAMNLSQLSSWTHGAIKHKTKVVGGLMKKIHHRPTHAQVEIATSRLLRGE